MDKKFGCNFVRVVIFCWLIATPVTGISQSLGDHLRTKRVNYPETGVALGQGWDSFLGERKNAVCVDHSEQLIEKTQSSARISEVRNTYSLLRNQNMSISAGYSGFGIDVSGSFSSTSKSSVNSDFLNYLISIELILDGTFIGGIPFENIPSYLRSQNERNGYIKATQVRLTTQAFKAMEKGANEFRMLCGDFFVTAIHRGAKASALATFKTSDKTEQNEVRAAVKADGFGANLSLKIEGDEHEKINKIEREVRISLEGGLLGKLPDPDVKISEIIDPTSVASNPIAYSISITPYSNLGEWSIVSNNKDFASPEWLSEISKYYLTLTDFYTLITDIEEEYYSNNRALLLEKDSASVNASQYPPANIDTFGGIFRLEEIKTRIQRYLTYIEGTVDACYVHKQCSQKKAVSTYANDILGHLKKNTGFLASSDSSNERHELLTLRKENIQSASSVTDLYSLLRTDEYTSLSSLNSTGSKFYSLELLEIFSEELDAFSDLFFLRFYEILANMPLPVGILDFTELRGKVFLDKEIDLAQTNSSVLNSNETVQSQLTEKEKAELDALRKIFSDPNADDPLKYDDKPELKSGEPSFKDPLDRADSIRKESQNALDELITTPFLVGDIFPLRITTQSTAENPSSTTEEEKTAEQEGRRQKENAEEYIRNLIYQERLRPWNQQFCEEYKSARLCQYDHVLRQIAATVQLDVEPSLLIASEPNKPITPKPVIENVTPMKKIRPSFPECWEWNAKGYQCP